jgi:hypothetical protein
MKLQSQKRIQGMFNCIQQAYEVLAPIDNHWKGRDSIKGQSLLCALRDTIASVQDRDPQDVQDEYSAPTLTIIPRDNSSIQLR